MLLVLNTLSLLVLVFAQNPLIRLDFDSSNPLQNTGSLGSAYNAIKTDSGRFDQGFRGLFVDSRFCFLPQMSSHE